MKHLIVWLERLTGEPQPQVPRPPLPESHPFKDAGIGYSQFNELLLSLGYDRVSSGFFKYVFGDDQSIDTFTAFRSGVEKFRKKAMLKYGNFKYAYKQYAKATFEELTEAFKELEPKPVSDFRRHRSLVKVQRIKRTETPYLGYLIRKRVLSDLKNATSEGDREVAEKEKQRMEDAEKRGIANHDLYLTYDHLDVYVATSMRRPFDFWNVSSFVTRLFSSPLLKELHPRWFDPTQAYCKDRLDKGLVEGLMLKRAACTIYWLRSRKRSEKIPNLRRP